MEALECIKTRRSVRKFTEETVTREQLAEVVAAAAYAPSWKNTQTVRYNAVLNKEKIASLANDCMMDFAFNQKTAVPRPGGRRHDVDQGPLRLRARRQLLDLQGHALAVVDAGVAAETFCLAAHAYGLGTVVMGVFDEAEVKKVVDIPEGEEVAALIVLGHPAEEPQAPARKDTDTLLRVVE